MSSTILWKRDYDGLNFKGRHGYSIRKVECHWGYLYDISVSPKRTSWYRNFSSFSAAKAFATKGAVITKLT